VQTAQELRIVHGAVLGLPLDFTDLVLILHTQFIQSVLQDALPIHLNTHVTPLWFSVRGLLPVGSNIHYALILLFFCRERTATAVARERRTNQTNPGYIWPNPEPLRVGGRMQRTPQYLVLGFDPLRQKAKEKVVL
jgi:hypothetical protein